MKRKILFIIIIISLTAFCFGQRQTRTAIQRIIQLTKPNTKGQVSFEEALSKLQNSPMFTGRPIELSIISQLAWAGLGNRVPPMMNQTVLPTTEMVLPTQLYIATNEGVFLYQPSNNSLEQTVDGDVRGAIAVATPMPDAVASAGCVIIVTSSATRSSSRRTGSSNRDAMLLEAGHIAQNIQLQAICLDQDLGSSVISEFDSTVIRKACRLARGLDALYMICVGFVTGQDGTGSGNVSGSMQTKSAAIIVPGANFEDLEFWATFNTLRAANVQTVVASNRVGIIPGMRADGSPIDVQVLAGRIRVDDFDAIVIIGGAGAEMFIYDTVVLGIVREAFRLRKIIGATSLGTSVLANAGILSSGVKVTGLLTEAQKIAQSGAFFTGNLVEEDSRIITCIGPQGANKFAVDLTDAIMGK